MAIFALVDCNNFYASCEKLFNPKLTNKPVVVLSNNDGCVVARSAEVKALGIPMGVPWFKIESLARQHGIIAFSSNYALYADTVSYTHLDVYKRQMSRHRISIRSAACSRRHGDGRCWTGRPKPGPWSSRTTMTANIGTASHRFRPCRVPPPTGSSISARSRRRSRRHYGSAISSCRPLSALSSQEPNA